MKKILFVLAVISFLTGCGNNLKCELNNDNFKLVFENGIIVKYYDSNGDMVDKSIIDEMNTYLKNAKNNKEAKKIIKDLLHSFGGNCN